jgi:hypothetical protein
VATAHWPQHGEDMQEDACSQKLSTISY